MADVSALERVTEEQRQNKYSSLYYSTWVSPERRYMYMGICKAACTKIKLALQRMEGHPVPSPRMDIHGRDVPGHSYVPSLFDLDQKRWMEVLTSPDWFRFTFVRNPYSRLLSAYLDKILNESYDVYDKIRGEIREKNGYPLVDGKRGGNVTFRDFVRRVAEIPDDDRDAHWRSQSGYMMLDLIDYDFIGRVESFAEDFPRVLARFDAPPEIVGDVAERVNRVGAQVPLATVYDHELAELVYQTYQRDFEAFGYDRLGWLFD